MEQIQHGNITGCVERTAQKLDFRPFVLFKVETVIVNVDFIYLWGVEALELSMVRSLRLCDCFEAQNIRQT